MNLRRLRFWGDAFALLAFMLPLLCFVVVAFYFTLGHAHSLHDANAANLNVVLASLAMTSIVMCGVGGLVFTALGAFKRQRRTILQGAFGLAISVALACAGGALAYYGGGSFNL